MMAQILSADTTPLESAVSVPPPIRAALYALLAVILSISLYIWVQAGLMIHNFNQTLGWIGKLAEQ